MRTTIEYPTSLFRRFVRPAACAALVLSVTTPLTAQTIRGQVADSVTRAPVGRGFVVLLDANDQEIARTLTTFDGRFTFTHPPDQQGPFRLRSERIGYRVAITEAFDASRATAADFTIWVGALPTPLAMIEVRESTECKVRPTEDEQTAVVWEEARKALAAASWTAARQQYRVITDVYERDLDRRQRRVLGERHQASARLTATPFRSRDPKALVRLGYVLVGEKETGPAVYNAPDAQVLQDEGFLSTHCFRLRSPDDEAEHLIGLAFEPAPSRDLPDVEGVLWLDRESSELRTLEYRYTNLPRDLRVDDEAGGTVEFLALPSGDWIVRQWHITAPTAFREERVDAFDREVSRRVNAFRETGGEVLTVRDTAGTLVYQTELAEIIGVVVDSTGPEHKPLAGATIEIPGTWFTATTNQEGVFRLGAALDGEYTVTFSHPRTDSLSYTPPPHPVRLARGATDTVRLAVPLIEEILVSHCPAFTPGSSDRILVGTVRDSATGAPVPDADVVASWHHITANTEDDQLQTVVRTDARGRYALCDFAVHRPAMLYAVTSDARSELLPALFDTDTVHLGAERYRTTLPIWRRDFTLDRPVAQMTLLTGIVADSTSGEPIAGATVTITGSAVHDTTDAMGMFRLQGVSPGSQLLTVRRPGYATRWGEVEVYDDQPTIVSGASLALVPAAQVAGRVKERETNQSVDDAWVTLISPNGDSVVMGRSDDSGAFLLTAPEPGPYYVAARRIGYTPDLTGPVQLRIGEVVDVQVPLSPLGFQLEPITISGKPAVPFLVTVGFYERQREGLGVFLDRDDIEKQARATELGQLLQAVPGIYTGYGLIRFRGISSDPLNPNNCGARAPLVFVDGIRIIANETVHGGLATPNSWSRSIHPINIEAIEVYRSPAEIPAQYNTGGEAACGVILIWTRRGGY